MQVVNETDVRTFTDADGDTLTTLEFVRRSDRLAVEKFERNEMQEAIREMGMTAADAFRRADSLTTEEREEAEEDLKESEKSDAVKRERLRLIVRGLTVGGLEVARNSIMDTYDKMPAPSVAWVDACVAEVWASAYVPAGDLPKPAASA